MFSVYSEMPDTGCQIWPGSFFRYKKWLWVFFLCQMMSVTSSAGLIGSVYSCQQPLS